MASERIYGLHTVRALLARSPGRVLRVYLQQGRADQRATEIEALARAARRPVERVDAGRLRGWVGAAAHQGVVAEVEPLPPMSEDEFYAQLGTARDPLLLALDGVQDPHNLGACLRSAAAAAVTAVIIPKDKAAPVNATVRKTSAGAADRIPVIAVTNLARTMRELKEREVWLIGADAGGESIVTADLTGPVAWVLGAEGAGLRRLTRESCDRVVGIPLGGSVESLNVSVAAGICLFATRAARIRG